MSQDYYEILGVSKDSDQKTIKKAYRKLAKELHPDRNPGDKEAEERFKAVAAAYETLSDPDKRASYDRFGPSGAPQGGFGGFGGFTVNIDDFFDRGFNPGPTRGFDTKTHVTLSFMEAIEGVDKEITIPEWDLCSVCDAMGVIILEGQCSSCNGTGGSVRQMGPMRVQSMCGQCAGSGKNIAQCMQCGGNGRLKRFETMTMTFPPGVEQDSMMAMQGMGGPGQDGSRGNLFIVVDVEEHPKFQRKGRDIHSVGDLPYTTAILGGTLLTETLHGNVKVKIPPGTQSGKIFRIFNKGVNIPGQLQGIHYLHVKITMPTEISARERELLEEIEKLSVSQ